MLHLKLNPSGLTITDIAKGIAASRNTVSKYVTVLELKEKIISKKIGAYHIYFNAEKEELPIINFYRELIFNLKREFPGQEDTFKRIGKKIAQSSPISLRNLGKVLNVFQTSKKTSMKDFDNILGGFHPYNEIFQESITVSNARKNDKNNRFHVRFTNLSWLDGTEEHSYHLYIIVGYTEGLLSKILKRNVTCNIEEVKNTGKDDSYIDILLEIK